MRLKMDIPRLRLWHLIGLVATVAAFLATFQFRSETEDDGYRWIRRLRSTVEAERAEAARELGALRPRERRAIGPLTEALFDLAPEVRIRASDALGDILEFEEDDPEAATVMAALARGVADPDPAARRQHVANLARFGGDPKLVVSPLIELARTGDLASRRDPLALLGSYARRDESARSFLLARMEDPDPEVRLIAIYLLSRSAMVPSAPEPYQASIRAALAGRAGDESAKVRGAAIGNLARLATPAGIEPPEVIEALSDPDAGVRAAVAYNLNWRNPRFGASPALVSALGRLLEDADPSARDCSARTLGRIGLDALPLLPKLRERAGDPEEGVRNAAAGSIAAIEKAAAALPKLIVGLDEAEPGARAYAASRLGKIGPGAAGAVPALAKLLGDPDADVRRASAEALGRIGPAASPSLASLNKLAEADADERVRRAASIALAALRKAEAEGSVPEGVSSDPGPGRTILPRPPGTN